MRKQRTECRHVLNVEGCEPSRFSREETVIVALVVTIAVAIAFSRRNQLKAGIEYIDMAVVKIGGINPRVAVDGGDGDALINRSNRGYHDLGFGTPVPG